MIFLMPSEPVNDFLRGHSSAGSSGKCQFGRESAIVENAFCARDRHAEAYTNGRVLFKRQRPERPEIRFLDLRRCIRAEEAVANARNATYWISAGPIERNPFFKRMPARVPNYCKRLLFYEVESHDKL